MPQPHICPQCSQELSPDAAAGLCPRCVVEGMLAVLDEDFEEDDSMAGASGKLGDYEILEKIARGGMGVVYRARQTSLDRTVALKLVLEGKLAAKQDLERFLREAGAAAELDHPNIVPIHEVGQEDGQYFYSMGLVEGGDLGDLLDGNPLAGATQRDFVRKLIDVARAVDYAHGHGILHRDLKPSNILLDENSRPRVSDFGLAKRLGSDDHLTMSGQVVGSPAYMAPEQGRGEREPTAAADIYSLGVILYQSLAGRVPFEGESPLETLQMANEKEPPPPRRFHARADRDLEIVSLKCLEKSPADRYASAGDFADDLERWLDNRPILAKPPSVTLRMRKWVRRKPAMAALLVTLVLSAAGFFIYKMYRDDKSNIELQKAYAKDIALAHEALVSRDIPRARGLLASLGDNPHAGFELRFLNARVAANAADASSVELGGAPTSLARVEGRDDQIAVSMPKGTAEVWDLKKRSRVSRIEGESTGSIRFDGGGRRLLFRRGNRGEMLAFGTEPAVARVPARMLDLRDTKLHEGSGHNLMAVAARARVVATMVAANPDMVSLWRPPWNEAVKLNPGAGKTVEQLCLTPDGGHLAMCRGDEVVVHSLEVVTLESESRTLLREGRAGRILCAGFSPNGKLLATGGADGRVRIWTWRARSVTLDFDLGEPVVSLCFLDEGYVAAAGKKGALRSWALAPKSKADWQRPGKLSAPMDCSPDGKWLAGMDTGDPNIVRVFRLDTELMPASLIKAGDKVAGLRLVGDELLVATAGGPGVASRVQVWPMAGGNGTPSREFALSKTARGGLDAAAFSPDGRFVYAKRGSDLLMWNTSTKNLVNEASIQSGKTAGMRFVFSPDAGSLVLLGGAGVDLECFDAGDLSRRKGFPVELKDDPIWGMASDQASSRLFVNASGGKLGFIDFESGNYEEAGMAVQRGDRTALSPEGKTLAVADYETGAIQLWQIGSRSRFFDLSVTQSWEQIFFNQRGDLLVGRGQGGAIYIWRAPFAK